MGTFSEAVEVVATTAGVPLHLLWHGRRYTIAAEPLRWYERRNWWDEETRAAPGTGAGLVEREIWRVQVRADNAAPGAELLTFDLARYVPRNHWRIMRIHDAAPGAGTGEDSPVGNGEQIIRNSSAVQASAGKKATAMHSDAVERTGRGA
ncbi:DUF6504 family protein [Arthrobacter cryoconiti]|uniref:DUF6504 family protein n=1 Tax=Arthrobacter cryoconiti TaxID=748907 RepID=A0ABV8R396_9MICC|nr:DUF6504 family protein [Arthrobacter cryoconiti]